MFNLSEDSMNFLKTAGGELKEEDEASVRNPIEKIQVYYSLSNFRIEDPLSDNDNIEILQTSEQDIN
jgi:hypothetical protein